MNARIAVLAGTALALLLSACVSGPARPPAAFFFFDSGTSEIFSV